MEDESVYTEETSAADMAEASVDVEAEAEAETEAEAAIPAATA